MDVNSVVANQQRQLTQFFVDIYKHASADSYSRFCKDAGISKQTFSNIISGRCPRLEILEKFDKADIISIYLTQRQADIQLSEAFDFARPLEGMIKQGYQDYMSRQSVVASATKTPQLRPNDQSSLSVETGISDRQLNRLFVKSEVKQPSLNTLLRLCYVFDIQLTFAPPASMAGIVESLKFNILSNPQPTLTSAAAQPE